MIGSGMGIGRWFEGGEGIGTRFAGGDREGKDEGTSSLEQACSRDLGTDAEVVIADVESVHSTS